MEKRAILAFILSFLVFLVWSHFFMPKREIPVENNKEVEEQVEQKSQRADSIPQESLPAQISEPEKYEETAIAPPVEEKKIVVETPLYIATLSNRGPSLTGIRLIRYKETIDPVSPPVELYTAQEYLSNYISFYLKDRNNLVFAADKDSIVLKPGQERGNLSFKYTTPDGITIEQVFSFSAEVYEIAIDIKISNRSGNQINGSIETVINNLPPKEKARYYSFTGAAALFNNELKELKPDDLEDEEDANLSGDIAWVAYENDYFISAVIPEETTNARFTGILQPSGVVTVTHNSASIELPPSSEISKKYYLFLGPRDVKILEKFGHKLDSAINYGFFNIIAGPLHFLLNLFNKFVKNYGLSIIILTIIIKIIFWPLTHKSQKSMKEMQKLQPLMAKIREKYKDNREMMNKELMGLYRTYKVNPMSGCLPMLIQIPVFFALYRVLNGSIELRHAPFALWITDLSAPDRLFSLPFSIPFMNPPYGIPVLTLLMGGSMFLQQKMQPMVGDPSQAKIMMFMPIMFTVMFINFPSGLVLYWLTQNILSIGQQYYINKKSD